MADVIEKISTNWKLGKVDYWRKGRKTNAVEVQIELRKIEAKGEVPEYWEFSVCGDIWNHIHTDIYCGGQCLDEIYKFKKANRDFRKVYGWWKEYHLNGMNAGTREQEKALKEWRETQPENRYDYKKECEYLKSIGLYEVPFYGYASGKKYNGEKYTYGHGWVINFIPEDVLLEMKGFIEEKENRYVS